MRAKRLTTQQIYHDLRRQIISFDLFPGSRVTETELADSYQISRTPIREALKRLEVEGLISIRPKQGCYVRAVDMALIGDYYTVRVALEAMAVELACQHMSNSDIQELTDLWDPDNFRKHSDNRVAIKQIEENFHVSIAKGGGNSVLVEYLQDVNNRIRPIRMLGFPDDKSILDTYEEHFQICTLIQLRDEEKAKQAMSAHIRKSQEIARSVTLTQLEQYRNKHP
ncbi:MAG: GntR family transcriptional regulator [Gammaproteobacteria bacterium]|nr:GntR family transcriptional regulator [Gammaproteobacteria bacterium]